MDIQLTELLINLITKHQKQKVKKKNCDKTSNLELVITNFCKKGKANKMKIAIAIVTTPPNLSGIERKIA
jgi:hypothetical protein